MLRRIQRTTLAVLALGAVAIGASAIAQAASDKSADSRQGTSTQVPRQRPDETRLTGDTADKVERAALAKVEGGSIIRVETDAEGSPYEAHVRKPDGSTVTVKVNKQFEVTDVEEGFGGPHGGPPPGAGG
jgi:hypothetical protein